MPFDNQDYQPAPVITDPVARVLWDAARYIREHGWCQNKIQDAAGQVCLLGAIRKANGFEDDANEGVRAMRAFLAVDYPHNWNDSPGRTSSEVISALEGCARELQGRGKP